MLNTCEDIQSIFSSYLDEELHNSDLREFESHVSGCEDCQESLQIHEREHSALRAHLRATPSAPDLLKKRLSLALDAEDKTRRSA